MIKKLLAAMLALFAAAAFAAVDANTATQAELEAVKGIGPAISGKIVEERKKAPFKDWQDMVTRVKGVGEHNSAKFSTAGLTVNGAAFTRAPAAPSRPQSEAPAQAPKAATKLDTSKPAPGQLQSAAPTEAEKQMTTKAAAASTKKASSSKANLDEPQSSAPVTAPAAKAMTAEERKAAKEKAKEEKAAKKAERAAKKKEKEEAAKQAKPAADAASVAKK